MRYKIRRERVVIEDGYCERAAYRWVIRDERSVLLVFMTFNDLYKYWRKHPKNRKKAAA